MKIEENIEDADKKIADASKFIDNEQSTSKMSKQKQASKIFATKNQVEEILDIAGKNILYYRIL